MKEITISLSEYLSLLKWKLGAINNEFQTATMGEKDKLENKILEIEVLIAANSILH